MGELAGVFRRYFEVLDADTGALRLAAHRLRYQVYCVEHPYEDAGAFPDGCERDTYDVRAVHSVVRHRVRGDIAATVRLILPDPDDPEALFPVERLCGESFVAAGFNPHALPRTTVAEISRFAVSKQFRRRPGEAQSVAGVAEDSRAFADGHDGLTERRVLPHITLGLFTAILRMSVEHGVTHWYAVMEPALLRLLSRFGIHFHPIGGVVEHHGLRQPCFGAVDEVLAGIWHERREVWELITDDGRLWPAPVAEVLRLASDSSLRKL